MDKAKEWISTLKAHLPQWCAEWIPDVDQWHPAHLWQWARTREWRVPELPRWGDDGSLVPEWVFPSYWRRRVREAVLWLWVIFITFLATREDRPQQEVLERSQSEHNPGCTEYTDDQRQHAPAVPEEADEEEDDGEAGGWRGGLERPGGLTRYPGIENLLAQPSTITPLPPRHRPPLPLAATQVSNKQILRKPDDTQSKRNEAREGGSDETEEKNHQDEVWKSLLAKYGTEECVREIDKAAEEDDEEEVPEYVGTAEEIVERYSAKFEEPQPAMSPEEEFTVKVGRRLEEYLQRLDEDDEETSQAKQVEQETREIEQTGKGAEGAEDATEIEEARDIEDGGQQLEGITSSGNGNRIFIVIEDEESEDDRRNLNDISEGSEVGQAVETLDSDQKEGDQIEEEVVEAPSSQQNGLSNGAEPKKDVHLETIHEASEKADADVETVVMLSETSHEVAEEIKDEGNDGSVTVTEKQLNDAVVDENVTEMQKENSKERIEQQTLETATADIEAHAEENIRLSGEEMKLDEKLQEQASTTSIEQPHKQVVMTEQDSKELTRTQAPEKESERDLPAAMDGQTLTTAEGCSEQHEVISEDVVMKEDQEEQDLTESESLVIRSESREETTVKNRVVEKDEKKDSQVKEEEETVDNEEKEKLEANVIQEVSSEENVVEEQETVGKDEEKGEEIVETEIIRRPPGDVKEEVDKEEEKKEKTETEVTEDDEKNAPLDEATEVPPMAQSPGAVEEIQVDDEAHFEDGKAEDNKDEAMVEEEHMEDEEVPVAAVDGWTQDVWGALGQAPVEATPLATPAAFDMMEEDTEDVMEVDVEEEVGETMEEDLEVVVDDVDLQEVPESPVPLPTVPEEDDNLAEVQDLLVRPPPRRKRRAHRLEEEIAATKEMSEAEAAADPNLAKYMNMPTALSAEEEEELRKYLAESGNAKELAVDRFMSMPTGLTEQEQKELDEDVRERERVRQAESAGLERFMDMPVGLTEQEVRELTDLEREKEEAAEQPWERQDVGFEDYLSMPHTLTEEEERMLQEGDDDEEERQFASEAEYREYIKNKFLRNLEEEARRVAEEAEYDYDEDYDYDDDYEYEDEDDEDEVEDEEDEDEGEMEGEYVMVSDPVAASHVPQAAAVPAATAATASAKMVDEAVNTQLDNPEEDAKSKKKLFPFPKKGDREATPEDNPATPQKKFFQFGSLGTKRKKETPDSLDKKHSDDLKGRKFDGGGGGGGSLSAAFCTMGGQITRAMLQKVKDQIREGKIVKRDPLKKDDSAEVSGRGGVGSVKTKDRAILTLTHLTSKLNQRDEETGDAKKTGLSSTRVWQEGTAEHLDSKSELEHVFAKIIKSYKSPSDQNTRDTDTNTTDNMSRSDGKDMRGTLNTSEHVQEEEAARVSSKGAEKDITSSPGLDIIIEEEEEEDAEVALVFTGQQAVVKAGDDEEDFWLRWSNEERACFSPVRDCASPWQLALDGDGDKEENEKALYWKEKKEGSSQTEVKVTHAQLMNNGENDKLSRNEEGKETFVEQKKVMNTQYKRTTERDEKTEETQKGSAMANVETTDAAKGAKGLRFKKRVTTRTENGVGGVDKKKEVVEEVEKTKKIEESGGKKIEVTTEKKKIEIKEERKKSDLKEDKRRDVKEEKKTKEIVVEEDDEKENGVEEESTEKKKKKKHRDREDGEKLRKKKKKKRDSEKENKKAAYQKRDDILEKHVGPRVRSFDAAKMKSKFEKPKVSQVSSECRQCGKQVFQMEKIVAEKAAWHKNCFRCKECNCILTLETYQSHEGVLYCKPHFKELFRPKVVVEDPDEARKERLLRRPKLIVLESQPEALADGIVRSTNKPDYGLEDLSHANLKQKFKMFEQISTEEERTPETIPVRRSHSLLSKAARFMQSEDDYGIENSELGEFDDDDEDEEEEDEEEDEEGEEGEGGDEDKLKKKNRASSFSGMKDLKAGVARKNRQDQLTKKRRQELAKFRQMLCAGKNISTREVFEGGNEDEKGQRQRKEQIKIEGRPDAKNLRERFEKGLSFIESDSDDTEDNKEVDRVLKDAETASKARNLFKQIDKTVSEGGEVVLRPPSSAVSRRENRLSRDGKRIRNFTSQVFEDESNEEEDEKSSLAERFKFFATYEERANEEGKRRKKLFRCSPPPDGEDQGVDVEELELGRDPNLVKSTDNYEDEVDCRGTRKLLAKFKKMEKQAEDIDKGPRPPKQFTPPPEGEEYDSDEEYSDEYSDEDEDSEEDSEEEDSEDEGKPKYRDEVLEMVKSSQSAKKAASLRAKFEKWESEVERNNEYNQSIERYEDEDECMPSIDTARNLRAMFENKAQESTQPVNERPKVKVNRFV